MQLQLTEAESKRFWSKVAKTDGCWITRATPSQRYGQLGFRGKNVTTHRLSYRIHVGEIPDGLYVCHHCDNTRCVRPDHLFLGTNLDNMADMKAKGRKAKGENHWSNRMPERRMTGDRHWSHVHPEYVLTGDRNGARRHPEQMPQGPRHHKTHFTEAQVVEIRRRYSEGGVSQSQLGAEFGVSQTAIGSIVRGKTWKRHGLLDK